MKFHPLSEDWYEAVKGKDSNEVISQISENYKGFREKVLKEMIV